QAPRGRSRHLTMDPHATWNLPRACVPPRAHGRRPGAGDARLGAARRGNAIQGQPQEERHRYDRGDGAAEVGGDPPPARPPARLHRWAEGDARGQHRAWSRCETGCKWWGAGFARRDAAHTGYPIAATASASNQAKLPPYQATLTRPRLDASSPTSPRAASTV